MQINTKRIEPYLPVLLKYLNFILVVLWKLGLGKLINVWPSVFGKILIIKHFGRDSRTSYLTPVNFSEKDGSIYVVSGFGDQSDWYLNIMANPHVEIWLPDGWYAAKAEQVEKSTERLPIIREVLIASGFAAPLFGIYPRTMNDIELEAVALHYRLLRIDRQEARTGTDGPGSLAWVWPIILAALCLRKRQGK